MSQGLFEIALAEVKAFYTASTELTAFMPFPDDRDLAYEPMVPKRTPPADYFDDDKSLNGGPYDAVKQALLAVNDVISWREPYKGQKFAETFINRFGTLELFGLEGHFRCKTTRGFVVYSDNKLYYPWHHHPAEEIYFIIAGEAEFATEGNAPKMLKAGDTMFHASNQPHNMQTHDKGVLAWVQWRGNLKSPPIFTDRLNE